MKLEKKALVSQNVLIIFPILNTVIGYIIYMICKYNLQSNDSGDVIISIQHYKAKNVSNNSLMLIPRKQISEVGLLKDVKSLNMKGERLYVVIAVVKTI